MLELRTEPFIDYIISRALINGLMNATINNTQINFFVLNKGNIMKLPSMKSWLSMNFGHLALHLSKENFIHSTDNFIVFPTCLVKNHSIIKFHSILIHCKSKSIRNFHWNVESVSQSSVLDKYAQWTKCEKIIYKIVSYNSPMQRFYESIKYWLCFIEPIVIFW